ALTTAQTSTPQRWRMARTLFTIRGRSMWITGSAVSMCILRLLSGRSGNVPGGQPFGLDRLETQVDQSLAQVRDMGCAVEEGDIGPPCAELLFQGGDGGFVALVHEDGAVGAFQYLEGLIHVGELARQHSFEMQGLGGILGSQQEL